MAFPPLRRAAHPVRVVFSTPALVSFVSAWKAAALAIAQLGVGAFLVAGLLVPRLGAVAPWVALALVLLSTLVRTVDIESWALLIPGGVIGRVQSAFGRRAVPAAAAVVLLERLLLAGVASLVSGHYLAGEFVTLVGQGAARIAPLDDLAVFAAAVVLGVAWVRARIGRHSSRDEVATRIWVGIALLLFVIVAGLFSLAPASAAVDRVIEAPAQFVAAFSAESFLLLLLGAGLALPAIGGGDALSRAAHDFAPPRIQALRRVALGVTLFGLVVTALGTLLFEVLVPPAEWTRWTELPLAGVAWHIAGPAWLAATLSLATAVASVLMLSPAVAVALADAEGVIERLARQGTVSAELTELHRRFGTPARAIDLLVICTVGALLASGGRVAWLAQAYGVVLAALLILKVVTLLRLRATFPATPYRVPFTIRVGSREWPLGLAGTGMIVATLGVTPIALGNGSAIGAAIALVVVIALLYGIARRQPGAQAVEDFDTLPPVETGLDQLTVRSGNVLVPVRNPHTLDHVAKALRTAGDRDVVVMTVRLSDGENDAGGDAAPTPYERRLFAEVVAIAERIGHPVHLLIVPGRSVVEAMVATIVRLRSSDVYVGESSSLSAEHQTRMLGDAWEATEPASSMTVRLVIVHRSGRTDTYHLGAHPPALRPADVELIHRVWLDAVKAIGPQVHHHDIVRAALTTMEHQLSGPDREEALTAIRDTARPAEELAAVLHAHDYTRLRDMLRNRDASDVGTLLGALNLEDQVVAFRVLPRKDAAAVFEYLSQDAKESLLKAMAQEDVAALLNNMAPDDRTMFLEELPAAATRQLLALLTPEERSVAVNLLGYPEHSVGRLMTPHYVITREHWTVQQVLDHVREHGRDSETLNVIYVVDDKGTLIDDIRIREFLLAPLEKHVSELMDRRFVALTATDDQDAAVAVFRQHDRSALPVTDTAGTLIGIVTIDDVLDVAEATATREIQRIGGSEALDEPYMRIAMHRMIRKRAGWLTALFLGEMLTATAMGFFASEIAKAVTLALFVPLIISSGGNSGSQASTLVIRAIALGEITIADWWRVMRREILVGLALGTILGAIGFLRITVWSAFSDIYGAHWLGVAVTVAISLVGVVLWGTLSGSLLPLLLRRLGFDPATSSAPFVATLVDVTGLIIYFSVALVVLRGTLL